MSRPPFRTLFPALGRISAYEAEHGRPLLSALAKAPHEHSPGFRGAPRLKSVAPRRGWGYGSAHPVPVGPELAR